MINKVFLILILTLSSCSSVNSKKIVLPKASEGETYLYTDKSGKYVVKISSGINAKDNTYFYKKSIEIPKKEKDNILEQSITFSELGRVKKVNILRPKMSQYTVWFDGKKYFTELKVNPKKKIIEVKTQSPESAQNGLKQIKFPTTKIIPCFFSQLVECVRTTGFLDNSIKKSKSKMSVLIIWEGYPFLNETYSDFPTELFSHGEFEYDGKTKEGEYRFNLNVAGQSIFYILNNNLQNKKIFWVSQGISMIEKSEVGKAAQSDEGE